MREREIRREGMEKVAGWYLHLFTACDHFKPLNDSLLSMFEVVS